MYKERKIDSALQAGAKSDNPQDTFPRVPYSPRNARKEVMEWKTKQKEAKTGLFLCFLGRSGTFFTKKFGNVRKKY